MCCDLTAVLSFSSQTNINISHGQFLSTQCAVRPALALRRVGITGAFVFDALRPGGNQSLNPGGVSPCCRSAAQGQTKDSEMFLILEPCFHLWCGVGSGITKVTKCTALDCPNFLISTTQLAALSMHQRSDLQKQQQQHTSGHAGGSLAHKQRIGVEGEIPSPALLTGVFNLMFSF